MDDGWELKGGSGGNTEGIGAGVCRYIVWREKEPSGMGRDRARTCVDGAGKGMEPT